MHRKLVRLVGYVAVLVTVVFMYSAVSIAMFANKGQAQQQANQQIVASDVAIILGAGLVKDKPSAVFRERINHGIALYQLGKVQHLIFTGGVGKGEVYSESEVAKSYALSKGVALADIYTESRSRITYENLLEAKKIMVKHGFNTALIVSDPLHMKRAIAMAQDLNIKAVSAPTPSSMYRTWSTKLKFLARETYFYMGYCLKLG